MAAYLNHGHGDVGRDEKPAVVQLSGNQGFGGRCAQTGERDHAQQWVGNGTAFLDAGVHGQVGILEDGDMNHVTRRDPVFDRPGTSGAGNWRLRIGGQRTRDECQGKGYQCCLECVGHGVVIL